MNKHNYDQAVAKKHAQYKSAYDAVQERLDQNGDSYEETVQEARTLHRELRHPYWNTEENEGIINHRKSMAALRVREALAGKFDAEIDVEEAVDDAAFHLSKNQGDIHEWALDEADKAGVTINVVDASAAAQQVPVAVKK